jgi:hypothetical protein
MSLINSAQAKAQLEIDEANTSFDAELQLYIDATVDLVERFVGPVEPRTVVETVRGGRMLVLSTVPVISLTSLEDPHGLLTMNVADSFVNPDSGLVREKLAQIGYADPTIATYVAGRSAWIGDATPASIRLAALITLDHLWGTQRANASGSAGLGDEYTDQREMAPGFGFAMPNRALALLQPYKIPTGIG